MLKTFKRGVHPFEGKELSKATPVKKLTPIGEMVFPISQHIGAPAAPIVNIGDRVLAGQVIAEAGGFVSSNIISSVSGTVKAIEKRRVPNGAFVNSIVIESDGKYELMEGIGIQRDCSSLSKEEIIDIIKKSGIVGLGGAGFPTHVKLMPKDPNKIDHIIINGAECEPYITCDYRMMMESPDKIIGGLKIILSLFPQAKGVIAVENNKSDAISLLSGIVKEEPNIEVVACKVKYPQGGERMLINAVTGRTLNSSMLPADVGCIVDNIATAAAIYDAVALSTPLMNRIVTISGDAVKSPGNFLVPIGTSYNEIIGAAGGFKEDPEKILSGGPMMGFSLFTTDIPVLKTSSAITAFLKDPVSVNPETPCIKCGKCVYYCPENLVPVLMMKAALADDIEEFDRLGGMECIECGSCAFMCPAKRPLTQAFKNMRVKTAAKKRADAAIAKQKAEAEAAKANDIKEGGNK